MIVEKLFFFFFLILFSVCIEDSHFPHKLVNRTSPLTSFRKGRRYVPSRINIL